MDNQLESLPDYYYYPLLRLPLKIVLSFILDFGFSITPVWASLAANSQVRNSSPLNPSNPNTLSFIIPSMKIHKVGKVLSPNLSTKNGVFSALMHRNCVFGNCWHSNFK